METIRVVELRLVTMITDPFRDGNGGEGKGRCDKKKNKRAGVDNCFRQNSRIISPTASGHQVKLHHEGWVGDRGPRYTVLMCGLLSRV